MGLKFQFKLLGVGYVKRKLANSIKPTMVISNHGQNWTVRVTLIGLKNIDIEFTENVPYFEASKHLIRSIFWFNK